MQVTPPCLQKAERDVGGRREDSSLPFCVAPMGWGWKLFQAHSTVAT